MNATQSVGEIQETRNYELFKFVKGNRAINRSHVNRLKEKISRRDLKEIPDNIKSELEIKPVRWIDEVLDLVLTRQPIPWEKDEENQKLPTKKSKPKKGQIKAH